MSLWQRIKDTLSGKRKKQEKEWASLNYGKPANPSNLTPLDPNDPWKT